MELNRHSSLLALAHKILLEQKAPVDAGGATVCGAGPWGRDRIKVELLEAARDPAKPELCIIILAAWCAGIALSSSSGRCGWKLGGGVQL
jgi:hypothetical protein